jgi:hypothetical protein
MAYLCRQPVQLSRLTDFETLGWKKSILGNSARGMLPLTADGTVRTGTRATLTSRRGRGLSVDELGV